MANTIVSLFKSTNDAQKVVQALTQGGFRQDDITVIGAEGKNSSNITNTLTSISVPESAARVYEEGVRNGGTLVTLRAEEKESDKAMSIIERYNAVDVSDRLSQAQASGSTDANLRTGTATQNDIAIPIMEEQLQVGKRQVERGGVRIYSNVTERPVEAEVRLREEHVHVERRPVDRSVSNADMSAFKEGVIEVTEMSEEAVVSKQARVVEEVVVGKDVRERSETVHDTVRRTEVDVKEVDSKRAKGAKGSRS